MCACEKLCVEKTEKLSPPGHAACVVPTEGRLSVSDEQDSHVAHRPLTALSAHASVAPADFGSYHVSRYWSHACLLEALPRESLIKLLLSKTDSNEDPDGEPPSAKKQKRGHQAANNNRRFDFSKYGHRHIALKVAYIGTKSQGFAHVQEAPTATVEGQLLHAMTKTCLISDRESSGISCGGHR